MTSRRTDIIKRIMQNVEMTGDNECWLWTGRTSGNGRGGGYPRMELDGQTVAVHRVLFASLHGYVVSKKQIDHTCCNRKCLNPKHLEMVTPKQNQRRRVIRASEARLAMQHLPGQIDIEEAILEKINGKYVSKSEEETGQDYPVQAGVPGRKGSAAEEAAEATET